jgi:hypothetical protein
MAGALRGQPKLIGTGCNKTWYARRTRPGVNPPGITLLVPQRLVVANPFFSSLFSGLADSRFTQAKQPLQWADCAEPGGFIPGRGTWETRLFAHAARPAVQGPAWPARNRVVRPRRPPAPRGHPEWTGLCTRCLLNQAPCGPRWARAGPNHLLPHQGGSHGGKLWKRALSKIKVALPRQPGYAVRLSVDTLVCLSSRWAAPHVGRQKRCCLTALSSACNIHSTGAVRRLLPAALGWAESHAGRITLSSEESS